MVIYTIQYDFSIWHLKLNWDRFTAQLYQPLYCLKHPWIFYFKKWWKEIFLNSVFVVIVVVVILGTICSNLQLPLTISMDMIWGKCIWKFYQILISNEHHVYNKAKCRFRWYVNYIMGLANVSLQLWVHEAVFILVFLFFIGYYIIPHRNNCKPIFVNPVFISTKSFNTIYKPRIYSYFCYLFKSLTGSITLFFLF